MGNGGRCDQRVELWPRMRNQEGRTAIRHFVGDGENASLNAPHDEFVKERQWRNAKPVFAATFKKSVLNEANRLVTAA